MDGAGRTVGAGGPGPHVWDRFLPWWNFAFGVTVAVTAAFAAVEVPGAARLAAVLGLYASLCVLYVLTVARWVGTSAAHPPRAGLTYLVGAFAIFTISCFFFPGSGLLLFILIAHCFMLLRLRAAFVGVVGLVLANAGAELAYSSSSFDSTTVASVVVSGAFSLLFVWFLGNYIGRIIGQSSKRATLIEELERTRGELAALSREAGALAERERLAGEIHDALAQGFTSVVMLVQAAQAALDRRDTDLARRQLRLAEDAARDGLSEARSLISALAPLPLQGTSLAGALERVCEDMGARFGFTARFEVDGQFEAEDEPTARSHNTEIVLLRAAQEALANVGRHASARTATVRLEFKGNMTSLEVTDDGVGFDVACRTGFGLRQLRSRVADVGGSADVCSAPGEGTRVRVCVPLGAGARAAESETDAEAVRAQPLDAEPIRLVE